MRNFKRLGKLKDIDYDTAGKIARLMSESGYRVYVKWGREKGKCDVTIGIDRFPGEPIMNRMILRRNIL